jgi:hypothetical protein
VRQRRERTLVRAASAALLRERRMVSSSSSGSALIRSSPVAEEALAATSPPLNSKERDRQIIIWIWGSPDWGLQLPPEYFHPIASHV